MIILVLNAGSSSLKWKLYQTGTQTLIASGLIEGIGEKTASIHLDTPSLHHNQEITVSSHQKAFQHLFEAFNTHNIVDITTLSGVGHRVVHGGEHFNKPTIITLETLQVLKTLTPLAPLHNPANILGIETVRQYAPHLTNIAVFDTAFHQSMPEVAYRYALPERLYEDEKIRRYGFHGTSHKYVAQQAASLLNRPLETLKLITLHLGNGASACAINAGKSVDTSMGFTPLEGLVMGTRSGDLDPAILSYLTQNCDMSAGDVTKLLNKESGLKGLCGDNDMRTIIEKAKNHNKKAQLALDIFVYRIKKYIGAYLAVLGGIDALIFTGGIGEHAPLVRSKVIEGLGDLFGFHLDEVANMQNHTPIIHLKISPVALLVVETNEELQIALETAEKLVKP